MRQGAVATIAAALALLAGGTAAAQTAGYTPSEEDSLLLQLQVKGHRLANPRLEETPEGPIFAVDIPRTGQASFYGDLLVYPQGKDEPAFVARGLGVYPEISSRHSEFAVSPEQAAAMRGPVKVELREPVARGGALVASVDTVLR